MSAVRGFGFPSYTPTGTSCGLMVREIGKDNEFGEDIGQIVAITPEGLTAPVRVDALMRSINYVDPSIYDSLSGKIALLKVLEKIGPLAKPDLLLEEPFQDESVSADTGKSVSSESKRRRVRSLTSITSKAAALFFFSSETSSAAPSPLQSAAFLKVNEIMATLADQNRDFKLSAALYDKIMEIFSYSQAGGIPLLDRRTSYLQIIPNGIPLNLGIFTQKPPRSPLNPQGDMTTTEEFSSLASMIFDLEGRQIGKSVESQYDAVIKGANSEHPLNERSLTILEKVNERLYVKVKDDITDEEYVTDSPIYARYKECETAYKLALSTYLATKNSYDLTKPEDQRKWQVESIMLQAKIDSAKNDRDAAGRTVIRLLEHLASHGNNAVEYVIKRAKDVYDNSAVTSQLVDGQKFHVSYGFPSTWFADDSGFSRVSFSSKSASSNHSSESVRYGGGASFNMGWWSVGGSFSSSRDETRNHVEASEFEFSFNLGTVTIQRPWMDTTLFDLENWNWGGQPPGKISRGVSPAEDPDLNRRTLPYYPTAFVVAKDIKVTGNWSSSDYALLQKSISGSTSVGIGPFRLSGANYSKSSVSEQFNSAEDKGSFTIPGAQIIGVINKIIPFAAPR